MDKWACTICGYVYDSVKGYPDNDVAPGTSWNDVPHDWVCPICGAPKGDFIKKKSSQFIRDRPLEHT